MKTTKRMAKVPSMKYGEQRPVLKDLVRQALGQDVLIVDVDPPGTYGCTDMIRVYNSEVHVILDLESGYGYAHNGQHNITGIRIRIEDPITFKYTCRRVPANPQHEINLEALATRIKELAEITKTFSEKRVALNEKYALQKEQSARVQELRKQINPEAGDVFAEEYHYEEFQLRVGNLTEEQVVTLAEFVTKLKEK